MFTVTALAVIVLLVGVAAIWNDRDRSTYDKAPHDRRQWLLLLHIRQELKLIAVLLAGLIVMLGVLADRLR